MCSLPRKLEIEFGKTHEFEGRAIFFDAKSQETVTPHCKILLAPFELRIILSTNNLLPWSFCELHGEITSSGPIHYNFLAFNVNLSKVKTSKEFSQYNFLAECITIGKSQCSVWCDYIKVKTDSDLEFIGKTDLQKRILYQKNNECEWNELEIETNDGNLFRISYEHENYTSNTHAYRKIIPYSILYPKTSLHLTESIEFIKAYIAFISLLKGSFVNAKEVELTLEGKKYFLYFNHDMHKKEDKFLFKLTRDKFDTSVKTFITDSIFIKFLENKNVIRTFDVWTILNLFVKANSFSNNEERFLFSFKLIEIFSYLYKRCYLDNSTLQTIKDDLQNILQLKTSLNKKQIKKFKTSLNIANDVLNTAERMKIILRNHKNIAELSRIDNSFIETIAKIRNDISHANPYFIDNDTFQGICWRTEILSYYLVLYHIGFEEWHILSEIRRHYTYFRLSVLDMKYDRP